MSYFYDVREKWTKPMFGTNPGMRAKNPYYEGYLNKKDRKAVHGYDFCADGVESFFYNLDSVRNELLEAGFDTYRIDWDIIKADRAIDDYTPEEVADMTNETRLILILGTELLTQLETERNLFVTSLIDHMDPKDYQKRYKRVWKEEEDD